MRLFVAHLLQETLQTKEELLFGRAYRFIDSEHAPPVKQQFPWLGPGNFWEVSEVRSNPILFMIKIMCIIYDSFCWNIVFDGSSS
jgi:hypothetical protein